MSHTEDVRRGHDKRAAFVRYDYKQTAWKAAAYSGPRAEIAARDAALRAVAKSPRQVRP
jgi:hypothetical protein